MQIRKAAQPRYIPLDPSQISREHYLVGLSKEDACTKRGDKAFLHFVVGRINNLCTLTPLPLTAGSDLQRLKNEAKNVFEAKQNNIALSLDLAKYFQAIRRQLQANIKSLRSDPKILPDDRSILVSMEGIRRLEELLLYGMNINVNTIESAEHKKTTSTELPRAELYSRKVAIVKNEFKPSVAPISASTREILTVLNKAADDIPDAAPSITPTITPSASPVIITPSNISPAITPDATPVVASSNKPSHLKNKKSISVNRSTIMLSHSSRALSVGAGFSKTQSTSKSSTEWVNQDTSISQRSMTQS